MYQENRYFRTSTGKLLNFVTFECYEIELNQNLRLHFPVLRELVHLFAKLHLLLNSLDVCGQPSETHPQVGCHLKGLREVRGHSLHLMAVAKVGGDGKAAVARHGQTSAAVV